VLVGGGAKEERAGRRRRSEELDSALTLERQRRGSGVDHAGSATQASGV